MLKAESSTPSLSLFSCHFDGADTSGDVPLLHVYNHIVSSIKDQGY